MRKYYRLFKTFKKWRLYLAYKYGFAYIQSLIFETRNLAVHKSLPM
jgi:hypothetical protein